MVLAQRQAHSVDPYCILGLKRDSGVNQLKETYGRLLEALNEANFVHCPQAWVQAGQAVLEIENAYERIISNELEEPQDESAPFWPKLGQMLVAAGKLTLAELQDITQEQEISGKRFGRILIERSLLTETELEVFLVSQGTIKLPDNALYQFVQRLIGLGIVPEDMAYAAMIEHCSSGRSVGDILVERGWLSEDILCVLVGSELYQA